MCEFSLKKITFYGQEATRGRVRRIRERPVAGQEPQVLGRVHEPDGPYDRGHRKGRGSPQEFSHTLVHGGRHHPQQDHHRR